MVEKEEERKRGRGRFRMKDTLKGEGDRREEGRMQFREEIILIERER